MASESCRMKVAGEREAGCPCAHCGVTIQLTEPTAICRDCGAVHHETCWNLKPRCGSYECSTDGSTAGKIAGSVPTSSILITRDELASAVPLPSRAAAGTNYDAGARDLGRRWNRASLWAFALSILGIPLFGLIMGLVAIVVACIALAGHSRSQRGLGLAVGAIIIGLGEVIGWAIGLSYYLGVTPAMVALEQFTIDPESLDELPEKIGRALRANVLIQTAAGLRGGFGSGVVLSVRDGSAMIVTNRHVVDPSYSDATTSAPKDLEDLSKVEVTTVSQSSVPGKIEWVAPHGVDLAIVSAPLLGDDVRAAHWDKSATPHIGDAVFAIGNPHGLGWTHTAGDISQVRRRSQGGYDFRILQTTAPINPGNSGGGLYDASGRLIGINTLTGDKRFAEGLGFSIALPALLDLAPSRLGLGDRSPAKDETPLEDATMKRGESKVAIEEKSG